MSAALISALAARLREERAALDALDAAAGDGDHGTTVLTGIEAALAAPEGTAPERAFRMAAGGASGPLFATLLAALLRAGAGEPKFDKIGLDLAQFSPRSFGPGRARRRSPPRFRRRPRGSGRSAAPRAATGRCWTPFCPLPRRRMTRPRTLHGPPPGPLPMPPRRRAPCPPAAAARAMSRARARATWMPARERWRSCSKSTRNRQGTRDEEASQRHRAHGR